MSLHWPVRTLLVAAAIHLCFSNLASAGPFRIFYLLQNNAATPSSVSALLPGTDSLAPVTLSDAPGGVTEATTTAQASHGSIGLFGSSVGFADIVSQIAFEDTLTFTSATLDPGTLVDVLVSFELDYTMSDNCSGTSVSRIGATVVLGLNTLVFNDDSCVGITNDTRSAILTFAIGQAVHLSAQLTLTAAAGNCCTPGALAYVDALSTLRFFVDPQATTFSYTSLTGQGYLSPVSPTPVPEPTSMLLFGTGLIGASVRRYRQSRGQLAQN